MALSLGKLSVLSALSEPLRAEIDIPDINADELATLRATIAGPEAFRTAGMEYNPLMMSVRVFLDKRPDGRSFLRLSSDRPVNDPFVDLILDANWGSGRIVRDYTMLFDPPNLKQATTAVTPIPPQISAAPVSPPAAAAPVVVTPAPAAPVVERDTVRPAPVAAARRTRSQAPQPVAAKPATGDATVTVKPGDTAGKIAAAQKSADVSLDQMLVAMLKTNPQAFINGDINRIRSGAVLNVPSQAQAQETPPTEARQMLMAQSKDFGEFRKKLAGSAPVSAVAGADRQSSGAVQAKVDDKKTATPTPDKLTLSKAANVAAKTREAEIAKERASKEAASRADELAKNIAQLDKLSAASKPAPAPAGPATAAAPAQTQAAAKPSAAAPAITVPLPPPAPATPAPAPTVAVAAPATNAPAPATNTTSPAAAATVAAPASATSTSTPQAASSVPISVASAAPAKPASAPVRPAIQPAPVAEPDLLDEILENPMVPAAGGGLLALLAGFGIYRYRQRKKTADQVDSGFLESRLQPDSFFGASGGQRVDTNDNDASSGESIAYSPSQLAAGDDVDPVAEADVYLAYGRDLQAEEILKEAIRLNPSRVAVHQKLLEIYAKRRDAKKFEQIAKEAYKLMGSDSLEWEQACKLGRSIDPENDFYGAGGVPPATPTKPTASYTASSSGFPNTVPPPPAPVDKPVSAFMDLDLDLDFSADAPEPPVASAGASVAMAQSPVPANAPAAPENSKLPDFDLDFDVSDQAPLQSKSSKASAPAAPSAAMEAPEFDLGGLSLDIGMPSQHDAGAGAESDNPLETKLALAEEFRAIGDKEGARSMIEEIIAEASGDMKAKAQKALRQLA